MSSGIDAKVAEIFRLCRELAAETGRPVVPDGHMVGAVGEAFVDRTAWDIAGDRGKPGQWTISVRQLAAHTANKEPNPFD